MITLGCFVLTLLPIVVFSQTENGPSAGTSGARRNFPLDKFYDVPTPSPRGKPGDLIRSKEFDDYDLPPDVIAVRILYHSFSASGDDVAVSGVVLYPAKQSPRGGWPLIAWAHDLNGVARQCAPSLARNLQHGPYLSMYLNLGYAVVATDYAGLGTASRNAFSDIDSNANDVIDSVRAARSAVPQLSSRWIAVGIGEGGPAAAEVGQIEGERRDSSYLGSIVISGLDDPQQHLQSSDSPLFETPLFFAYGINTVYRDFNPKNVLTEKGIAMYADVQKSCVDPGRQSPSGILKPDWASNRFVKQYFARNVPGQRPAPRPMLVISSALDPDIPITRTAQIISKMCKQGDEIQFELYAESPMSSLFGDSVADQISWMRAIFADHAVANTCLLKP